MRWNCPHCGTSLAVTDDKLSAGWAFSRCYKCAGFALVRRSDVNLIKVDRAPAGEQVILPEAHEDPTTMLSQAAINNLNRYVGNATAKAEAKTEARAAATAITHASKPAVRPAVRRSPAQTQALAQAQAQTHAQAQVLARAPVTAQPPAAPKPPVFNRPPIAAAPSSIGFGLPEPLPEEPIQGTRQRLVPVAVALTGMLAIGSGIYLYVQGQALWEKARNQATQAAQNANVENPETPAAAPAAKVDIHASSEVIQAPTLTAAAAPVAPAPTSAGSANITGDAETIAARGSREVVDEVHARAMAPARAPAAVAVPVSPSSPFSER